MKKKTKIILTAATLTILSLTVTAYHWQSRIPSNQPDSRPASALTESSRDNAPPPSVEYQIPQTVPSQNDQSSTQNQPADNPMEEQNITPSDNSPPQTTEKEEPTITPTPTIQAATKPNTPTPKEPPTP